MAKANIQQVEVTKVASYVRRSGKITKPLDLVVKGRVVGRVIPPLREPSPAERKRAWRDLQAIQRKVGRMMKKRGKTEAEFDRIVQRDT
jgi:hypothetical protein